MEALPKSLARVRARHSSPSGPRSQEPEAARPSQTPMAAEARGSRSVAGGEESWAAETRAAPASEARRVRREVLLSFVLAVAAEGAAGADRAAVDAA